MGQSSMIVETSSANAGTRAPDPRGARIRTMLRRQALALFVTLFIILFAIVYFAPNIFFTIQSGQVGVMYLRFFGGTQTDRVLGEGLKIIPPWDKVFIYNVRVQEQKHDMNVLTKEGMSATLHLSIRYHPETEMVGLLHERVGPKYADRIVIPEVEQALRTIMGEFELHEVYGSQRGLVQKAINDSLEQVSQKFVKVDSIVLRSVELPSKVKDAIEEKMTQKELSEAYEYKLEREKQEADRKKIEAEGIKTHNDILNSSLNPSILKWEAIQATKELATSPNAKTIIVGTNSASLPVMLNSDK
jgi:regulator of protease activity HflC (stomatin/prohibitin superfamily)